MRPETWRPVVGFEPYYEVSDLGRVRRIGKAKGTRAGRLLRPKIDRKGYHRATLTVNYRQKILGIHRMVAEAFLGPCPPGFECNHLDGDKANNTPTNLEWVTGADNVKHAWATGLSRPQRGAANGRAKLTEEEVAAIAALRGTERQIDTARRFGISDTRVSQIQHAGGWS